MNVSRVISHYQTNFSSLVKNSMWLLSSEVLGKGSRLLTIVVLAANLSPTVYGSGMLALACHDILRLLLRSGTGTQVIQCAEKELTSIAQNAMSLQWLMCGSLMLLQLVMASISAHFFDNEKVGQLLTIMAFSYLLFPMVSVKVFLLHRSNKMAYVGVCNGVCLLIENLSIALMVYLSKDVMAIAYGKIIFAIAWYLLFRFAPIQDFGIGFDWAVIKKLFSSSSKMIFAESAKAVQQHLDVFFAAKLLSPESFGLYTFAKSAGIGLSLSLNGAFNNALFPLLCTYHREHILAQKYKGLYWLTLGVSSAFIMQAAASYLYIPWLFDSSWTQAIPVVSLLCLSACAALFIDVKCSMLRAVGRYMNESQIRLFILLLNTVVLFCYQPSDIFAFAWAMLCLSVANLLVFMPIQALQLKPSLSMNR